MSKMTGEDKFWAALGGQRSKTPAADALQQSPGAWAGMVQEKLQIPGASQFWESIRNAPQAAPQQAPGTGEMLTPGKWLGGLGSALGQTRSVGAGAMGGTAGALGATVQRLPGLQQLAKERVQRGLFTAGTTEETNRMVNDYLRQQAAYQSTKDDRKNLQAEQKKLEKKYASGTVSKEYYEIKKKKIAQELKEMGSAPVRTLNAKDYANQHSSAGQEDTAARQKRAEAAKWQRLMEAEERNWQEAQTKYQPDSRDYAAAKDRYNTKYRSYRALYNAAAKQLPGAYTETEKRQQQNAQDIAALGNRLQAAYDDIDERFAGENPETNQEYQAALQNVEALRQQYDRLAEEVPALEKERKAELEEKVESAKNTNSGEREAVAQSIAALVDQLQAAYDDIDERFAGEDPATNPEYQAALQKAEALQKQYDDAQKLAKSLETQAELAGNQARLDERNRAVQRYETDRYQEDFHDVAAKAMRESNANRQETAGDLLKYWTGQINDIQDPVGYLLGHFGGQMAGASDDAKRWVMLSDDELEEYYYLLGSQGKDAAMEYMDALEVTLDKRRTEYQQANTEMLYGTSGAAGKTAMNVASVPASVIGGITSGVADVKSAITGKFNPYSPGHELTDYATTVRGVTARDIMSQIDNPFWSKIAGNTYQALMSGADSALGATLFGNGYTWIMGSNAASQRARELYEKGASDVQIGLGAIASGLVEVATEDFSVEYFTKHFLEGDIQGFRDWAKKTLIQGFNEGSEEVASDLANLVADAFIEGAGSDYRQSVQEFIDQGMSPEEAEKQALKEQVIDTVWSFYGGALSGGMMGGIGGVMNAVDQKRQQRAVWQNTGATIQGNNGVQDLLDTAQGLNVNEKLLQLAQERAAKRAEGYRASQRQENRTRQALGKLYEQVLNAQAAAGDSSIQEAFQGAAEQALEGKVEDPQTAAAAVAKTAAGEQLTEREQAALQTVEGAGGVDALVRQVQESPEFRQAAVTQREAAERTAGLIADKGSPLNPENLRAARETVAAAAEDYDNPQEMVSAYRQGQDPEAFIAGYRAAYNYGSIGLDERWSLKSRNTQGRLTEEQILAAHNAGRKAAGYEQAEGNLSESQKWNDMRSAQQQGAAVAEETAIQEAGSQTDAAGAGAADNAVRKVSAQALGLRNGTAEENLTVTPKERYGKAERAAAEYAESQGLNLTVVTGGSIKTVEQVDGKDHLVKSRALIDGDTMIVRGDDPMFTAEQLVRHEAAHRQIENGEIDLGKATRELVQKYTAARVKEIIRLYAEGYSGSGMNAKEVLEEIICDSMGSMNAFATESTARVAGEVGAFLRDAQRAASGTEAQAAESKSAKTGVKFSREMDSEGNVLTEAQEKYFAGSQVRDEKGNLIPVHHRTDTEFYTFKRSGLGQNTLGNASDAALAATALVGHWFSDHETELGSKDVKAYLNIQNPYQTSLDALAAEIASFAKNPEQMQERYEEGQYNMVRKAARDYVRWMRENGYDGLEVSDPEFGGKSYVILDSRQAKLTDNQSPTEKNDIRYSREMDRVEELERQNELLRQRVDYWHMQTEVTAGKPGADKAQVRTLARKLVNQYGSQTRTSEILPELQWLADNRRTESETVTEQDLFDTAENVAKTILDGSSIDVNAEQKEQAKALRRLLDRRYINVDESLKEDIGDFKEWKKQNRALHFREDGTGIGVDTLWQELQEDFGAEMFPDSIVNPADQIRHIADKLGSMQELWQAPYSAEMETAVSQLRSQIMAEVLELGNQQPTRADKAIAKTQRELEWLVQYGARKEQRRVESVKQTTLRQQIKGMNDKFQRMALKPGKGTTQHAPQELLSAVQNFCELFTGSEARRAERWQKQLNTRTEELTQQQTGDTMSEAAQEEYRKIAGSQERLDKMTARLSRLQSAYSALANGSNDLLYDETVNGMLQSLRGTLEGTDIYEMSARELEKVKETMTALMHTVTEANKAFSMGKDKTVTGMAQKWAGEMRQVNHQMPGLKAMSGRYWMWQMTPDTFFNYTCGYIKNNEGQNIQKAFQRGSERMMEVQREYYDMFQEFTESKDKAVQKELKQLMNEPLKNMVEIGIKDQAGNEVKVSRGMMLQIYMLLQQKDSFESLQYGGFALPNAEAYYKGKVQEAYGNAAETAMLSEAAGESYMDLLHQQKKTREQLQQLNESLDGADPEAEESIRQQIRQLEQESRETQSQMESIANAAEKRLTKIMENIEKQLTPLERQLMDKAHEWYSHTGELMGDVFLQMYGYMPRLVENYVPIHRDPSTIKTDIRNMSGAEKAFNLENSGFTIERVRNSQPILLTDFFQELEGQKEKMSRYVGFAQVQKDFGKIWKTRVSGNGMTVNKLIAAKFGAGNTKFGVSGVDFVEHYIADVAGGHKSEDVLSDLYGNYAAATLRLNPRVAVSQAASIPTAASVVGWKSMAAGFAKGLPKAMSTQYRNDLAAKNVWFWQRYRGQGGSTELADIRQKGNVIEKVANSNVGKKLFNWCQTVDVFSTGSIMWSAAEDYVQRTKGIQPGAEGYEAAVNETYTDIIRKSQPNYTTTERADLLRDQRAHMKLLTMFKTQSSQNLNLLMEANGEFIRMRQDFKNGANGVTAADVKAAKVKLANASTGVFLGGTVAFVGLRTIMNFILGAVNPYRDKDTDEVTLGGTMKGMGKEVLSSLSGTVAMGGQIYDIMMSVISGDTYYGLSDSAISTISDTLENTQKVLTNLLDSDKEVTGNQVWKMTNSWCQAFGIPAGNAKKLYTMVDTYIRDIRTGKLGQYTTDYTTTSQYRERVVQGVLRGENQRADDALAMLFAKSGKDTDEETQKDIASGMRTYLKNQYMAAEITDLEAIRVMEYTGTEDPEAVIARWDFMLEHPEVDSVSDNLVTAYNNRGNLDGETVIAAYKFKGQASKEETVQYIQGLTIPAADKKKLWNLIKGSWKDKDTPWA